jgi:hypothetical protein
MEMAMEMAMEMQETHPATRTEPAGMMNRRV